MEPILHRDVEQRGLTPKQLRGSAFAHPVDGVSVLATDAADLRTRTLAALAVMPTGTVATHLTAARLRDWWLPQLEDEPVIVCTDRDAVHLDRRGVYVRRCAIPPHHRTVVEGVPIASAEWTIVELAETLSLVDLVVVIDSALSTGDVTVEGLHRSVVPGRRGVRHLRTALLLCDGRSESPGETALRLVHTLSAIAVDVQVPYRDADGTLLFRLDLRVRGTAYAPEFDGGVHRDPATHRNDLRRERLLHRFGVRRAGYTFVEIRSQAAQIVASAAEALGRPGAFSASDAITQIERSSLTVRGEKELKTRLRRFERGTPPRRR